MQNKSLKLSLKSYLNFADLLGSYRGDHESNRTFALKHDDLPPSAVDRLLLWAHEHRFKVTSSPEIDLFLHRFSMATSFLVFFSLFMGVLVGIGLLSYSGDAPVNVIYFFAMTLILPLLSMLLSLISMISRGEMSNFITHLFPLYWLERLIEHLPDQAQGIIDRLPASVSKWIFLERLQRFSLFFSIGILLALMGMVVVKDIAFGWSSTLNITAEEFHALLSFIAMPWESWIPSAVPSLELVELSHYFRLGEKLESEMIQNADKLGAWWKFLAMSTLVYAVILRFIFWMVVRFNYQKALEKSLLVLEGVSQLLREFDKPFVSTNAPSQEKHLDIVEETEAQVTEEAGHYHDVILGWNFSPDEIRLANDTTKIIAPMIHTVGGSHTFEEDEEIASGVSRHVLLYVKSWEPPTMDFVDFLEILIENPKVETIEIYPLGTAGRYYESEPREVAVWKRKIQGLNTTKVWVIDAKEQK